MSHSIARTLVTGFLTACALNCIVASHVRAQEKTGTVADGVYADPQAARGAVAFQNSCSACHRDDLSGGANGPPLRGERFTRDFAGKDLKALYTRISTTMPRGAPASLEEDVYLDIVAHVLRENGFPAGPKELNAESLGATQILPGRMKPPPPVGDFSYVSVVGCLTPGPMDTWLLTSASEPVGVPPSELSSPRLSSSSIASTPLGTGSYRLLDAMAYTPQAHTGQKLYIRGLLIKLSSEQRITISSLETLAADCR
jgi:mono/diheme cytochrome c family protein